MHKHASNNVLATAVHCNQTEAKSQTGAWKTESQVVACQAITICDRFGPTIGGARFCRLFGPRPCHSRVAARAGGPRGQETDKPPPRQQASGGIRLWISGSDVPRQRRRGGGCGGPVGGTSLCCGSADELLDRGLFRLHAGNQRLGRLAQLQDRSEFVEAGVDITEQTGQIVHAPPG